MRIEDSNEDKIQTNLLSNWITNVLTAYTNVLAKLMYLQRLSAILCCLEQCVRLVFIALLL